MEKEVDFKKVVKALKLCGPEYHTTSCDECPYKKKCLPGDNTPLLEDAALLLERVQEAIAQSDEITVMAFELFILYGREVADIMQDAVKEYYDRHSQEEETE